jgi:hypothetical protein
MVQHFSRGLQVEPGSIQTSTRVFYTEPTAHAKANSVQDAASPPELLHLVKETKFMRTV